MDSKLLGKYHALYKKPLVLPVEDMDDTPLGSVLEQHHIHLKDVVGVRYGNYILQLLLLFRHDITSLTLYRYRHIYLLLASASGLSKDQHNQVLTSPNFHQKPLTFLHNLDQNSIVLLL